VAELEQALHQQSMRGATDQSAAEHHRAR
jgi:hypothetical protein